MTANIRPKNNQDAYDKVLKAIRKQKYIQSNDDSEGICAYRGSNGLRCAAGHLIPNSLYRKEMEGKHISALKRIYPEIEKYFENAEAYLLADLQMAHDFNLSREGNSLDWETKMKQIAFDYSLVYAEPSKESS
jgi:hypothetical protein